MDGVMADDAYQALTAFVVDNPDLERLEGLLAEFNIFEAVGAVRQEVRHSDFLAFLLDPSQNHGLEDAFLKRLLKRVLAAADTSPVGAVEIDVMDLDGALLRREWNHIDILVQDDANRFLCVIENKIDSGEHGDQLQRYRQVVAGRFPDYRAVFIFLTPEGREPSDDAYLPVSYGLIVELVETMTETHASTLGPDVRTLMRHYATMLRRYIVSESQIADLCRKLYQEHRQALDLIFEYRPDLQWEIHELLKTTVLDSAAEHGLELDHCVKNAVRFTVKAWDAIPAQRAGSRWTPSNRLMLFEFLNSPVRISLSLIVGPGPVEYRSAAIEAFRENPKLFGYAHRKIGKRYNSVYLRRILTQHELDEYDSEAIQEQIAKVWETFLSDDLPRIKDEVSRIQWPSTDKVAG